MTILGVFFFASIILTSCGGPEADAKKSAECICDIAEIGKKMMEAKDESEVEDLTKDLEKLEEKCKEIGEDLKDKYKDEESEDAKKYLEALDKEMKNCK